MNGVARQHAQALEVDAIGVPRKLAVVKLPALHHGALDQPLPRKRACAVAGLGVQEFEHRGLGVQLHRRLGRPPNADGTAARRLDRIPVDDVDSRQHRLRDRRVHHIAHRARNRDEDDAIDRVVPPRLPASGHAVVGVVVRVPRLDHKRKVSDKVGDVVLLTRILELVHAVGEQERVLGVVVEADGLHRQLRTELVCHLLRLASLDHAVREERPQQALSPMDRLPQRFDALVAAVTLHHDRLALRKRNLTLREGVECQEHWRAGQANRAERAAAGEAGDAGRATVPLAAHVVHATNVREQRLVRGLQPPHLGHAVGTDVGMPKRIKGLRDTFDDARRRPRVVAKVLEVALEALVSRDELRRVVQAPCGGEHGPHRQARGLRPGVGRGLANQPQQRPVTATRRVG